MNYRNGDSFSRTKEVLDDVRHFLRRNQIDAHVVAVDISSPTAYVRLGFVRRMGKLTWSTVSQTPNGAELEHRLRGIVLMTFRPAGAERYPHTQRSAA
jgi:hypothetical protein